MDQNSPGCPRRLSVVVTPTKPNAGSALCTTQTYDSHNNRRIRPRVGSPLRTESNAGSLAPKPSEHAHKSQRTVGSPKSDRKLGNGAPRGNHPILDGQPNGRILHLQTRGDKVTLHDPDSKELVSTCKLVKHLPTCELHTRCTERRGRHVLTSGSDSENRVDTLPTNLRVGSPKQPVWAASGGPLCEPIHSATRLLRVTMPGPDGVPSRRTDSRLAKIHDPLCVPSDVHYGQSDRKNSTRKTEQTNSPGSNAHESGVVPLPQQVVQNQLSHTIKPADTGTTPLRLQTSEPQYTLFDDVSHRLPRLDQNGYSPQVIKHLSKARAKTTNQSYDSKWKLFQQFAKDNKFDPITTSPAQLAEFLTHLFEKRTIRPNTIKGYRAAIGHVLRLATGYDPGDDLIIKTLLKSFERQRPTVTNNTPSWDVALVLEEWANTNNDQLTLELLQTKTIFLLALASGARRGELWALTAEVKQVSDNPVTLAIPYNKQFVFKTQFTRQDRSKPKQMIVQALPGNLLQSICPVKTILDFLTKSKAVRKETQTSLFIPLSGHTFVTTKQMISAQVVKAIKWAYRVENTPFPKDVKAHDVRGVAATLRVTAGQSIHDVLEAGNWTNPMTYFKHYNQMFLPETLAHLKKHSFLACAGKVISTDNL